MKTEDLPSATARIGLVNRPLPIEPLNRTSTMVTAVTGFLTIFRHAGLATPTIQREHITQAQVSNFFWLTSALARVPKPTTPG
jgi:Polysaccharide biosynthesis protein